MSLQSAVPCPHERRPGITSCLHCRHAERAAVRAQRRRTFVHLALPCLAVAALIAAGVAAAGTLQERRASTLGAAATAEIRAAAAEIPAAAGDPSIASAATVGAPSPLPLPSTPPVMSLVAPLSPIVAEGRTDLPDSLFAVRVGDTVTVHFDTELGRTRSPEKFERVVRETLAAIYGPAADSLLATIPEGTLATGDDLLTELPARGLHLPLAAGRTLALWPETRPGRDGPIVVTYRALVR